MKQAGRNFTKDSVSTDCRKSSGPVGSVVDLFCGAGALSHGFLLESFKISCGYDVNEYCRYPFEHNNCAKFVRSDIMTVSSVELKREFTPGLRRVLIGCAPCQRYSKYTQGRSRSNPALLGHFSELIAGVLPDVVSMENVPQLTHYDGGRVFKNFVRKLEDAGFHVRWKIVDCTEFGTPQARSRLVLIGSRLADPKLPTPEFDCKNPATVKDTIGNMPPLKAGEVCPEDPLHRASRMSQTNMRRIKASRPGGTWQDWDQELVADCHRKSSGYSYRNVYGRMRWDRPAPTITTQFNGFGNGRFGHPDQDRAISLREGALLQTFPKNYEFYAKSSEVSIKELCCMIGNAVPVALSRAIAKSIANHLETST